MAYHTRIHKKKPFLRKNAHKRSATYTHMNMNIVKAEQGRVVRNPNAAVVHATKNREFKNMYSETIAEFCSIRGQFETSLNNNNVRGVLKFGMTDPYIEKATGTVVGNPDKIHMSIVMRDPKLAMQYYKSNPSVFGTKEQILDLCKSVHYEKITYSTSFSFMSDGAKETMPSDFSRVDQVDSSALFKCKLDVRSNVIPPVVGYLLKQDVMEDILSRYSNHCFYKMNMSHVLTSLVIMSRDTVVENKKTTSHSGEYEMFGDPNIVVKGKDNDLRHKPVITMVASEGPYKVHPAYGTIKIYDQTYEIDQPFVEDGSLGLPWTNLSKDINKLLQSNSNLTSVFSHRIAKVKLLVRIKTWTLYPQTDTPLYEDPVTKGKSLDMNSCTLESEMILHQVVEVSSTYLPNNPHTLQANGKFVFVTTNRGMSYPRGSSHTFSELLNDVGCITQHFGNGLPLQVEIKSSKDDPSDDRISRKSWYSLINKNIAVETLAYGADKMVQKALNYKIEHNATFNLDHLADTENLTQINLRKTFALSWKKNFQERVAKTETNDGEQPYHYLSYSKPWFACIVIAPVRSSAYALVRAIKVIFYAPQGHLKGNEAYAPNWDLIEPDPLLDGDVYDYADYPESAKNSPRGDDGFKQPLPKASGPVGIDDMASRYTLDSDDERDLQDIMMSASRPSLFDNEVYM